MNVRNATYINNQLNLDPLPNGFVSIPIYSFTEKTIDDDIAYSGCSYTNAVDSARFPNDATYTSVDYLLNDLRVPVSTAFGLSAEEE